MRLGSFFVDFLLLEDFLKLDRVNINESLEVSRVPTRSAGTGGPSFMYCTLIFQRLSRDATAYLCTVPGSY